MHPNQQATQLTLDHVSNDCMLSPTVLTLHTTRPEGANVVCSFTSAYYNDTCIDAEGMNDSSLQVSLYVRLALSLTSLTSLYTIVCILRHDFIFDPAATLTNPHLRQASVA